MPLSAISRICQEAKAVAAKASAAGRKTCTQVSSLPLNTAAEMLPIPTISASAAQTPR